MTSERQKAKNRDKSRKHRNTQYEKVFARAAAKQIPKKPCEYLVDSIPCGELKVEGHHYLGYKHPYKVVWYCKTHHEIVDTALDKERKE